MPEERAQTQQQIEANEALQLAIEQVADAYEMVSDGWITGDWVVGVEFVPLDPSLIGRERYGFITPQPTIPSHRIRGLLMMTEEAVIESREGTE